MADFKVVDLKDAAGVPIHGNLDVDGQRVCNFMRPNDVAANIVHEIVNMELRNDDIMLCTPAKSGKKMRYTLQNNGMTVKFSITHLFQSGL